MKRINSLSDLLIKELVDLLDAEIQLIEVLPKMIQASESSSLKMNLADHLKITKDHIHRLQDIFSNIGQNAQGVACKAMKEFIMESEAVMNKTGEGQARDAAIISVVQRMEQYKINGYETAREHAYDLGHTMIVEVFTTTLEEERLMNLHLNELAQSMISAQATEPKRGGFYIPEGKFNRKKAKKKNKSTDVSRFIDEGNPNIQDQNLQNPEEQGGSF